MKTIIIMAQTLDGVIAQSTKQLANWTSKEDKAYFVKVTKAAGAIIFGRTTFSTFKDKPLPDRLNIVMTLDGKESEKNINNLLEFTTASPQKILASLKKRNFKQVFIGGGSMINSLYLDKKLVDEIWITIEPKIFGAGLRLFTDKLRDINLKLISAKKVNQIIIAKYEVKYGHPNQT